MQATQQTPQQAGEKSPLSNFLNGGVDIYFRDIDMKDTNSDGGGVQTYVVYFSFVFWFCLCLLSCFMCFPWWILN